MTIDKLTSGASVPRYRGIAPVLSGWIMIIASALPWIEDPLGKTYTSWEIPIDIGWQWQSPVFSYGLLCLCGALSAFYLAYADRKLFKVEYLPGAESSPLLSREIAQRHRLAGLLCMLPCALFFFQYLLIDISNMQLLAQHKVQALLIAQHFGYSIAAQRIQLNPFSITVATFWGRLQLLIDQLSPGIFLPLPSALLLLDYQRFFKNLAYLQCQRERVNIPISRQSLSFRITSILLGVLLIVIFGRAPAAVLCDDAARVALSTGDYANALHWLDIAHFFNPTLDQAAYFHIERGQALYYLFPAQQSDESRAYLASAYRAQGDYLDSYQELLALWRLYPGTSWITQELSLTLERLAEYTKPLNGPPVQRPDNDDTALPWLQLLTQVDAGNAYGQYLAARIQFDLHNYSETTARMIAVLHLSTNMDIQSSAYTYMALSAAEQGNYVLSRNLLFKALTLDPEYRNNTARQELSGLR